MALPRLTGALRAFSSVSPEDSDINQHGELAAKRRQRAERESARTLSWGQLAQSIQSNAQDVSDSQVTTTLRQLTHIARDIGQSI